MNNKLLLGIGKEIITPEVGGHLYGYDPNTFSESVHDDLTATAYAFEFGTTKVLFISTTVCALSDGFSKKVRMDISEKTGYPIENIIVSATHTHSGPCLSGGEIGWGGFDTEYAENIFCPGVLKAAVTAIQDTEPVLLGVAEGKSYVAVNRREIKSDNRIDFGQNPWGPLNSKMTVLSFKTLDGKIKGNIVAYGCHGTAAGKNHEITRDWSGIMTDALENVTGGVTAFFNGTIGDSGPRISNGKTVGNITYVEELGAVAAEDVLRIYNSISEYKEDATIAIVNNTLKLPLAPRESYEYACEKCREYEGKNLVNLSALTQKHFLDIKESYENGYIEEATREIDQTVFRIGNVAFVTSPYEMFSEIGLRIDKEVEDLNVYLMSNANGSQGYFPTQDQLCRGGYEVGYFLYRFVQRFTDDADYQYIKATRENFEKLER